MDPSRRNPRRAPHGFPRTRGDGPGRGCRPPRTPAFPPHTRGWTACNPTASIMRDVSPAHAGMDRPSRSSRPPRLRFPRTRGDGPLYIKLVNGGMEFPPHTRGWTGQWVFVRTPLMFPPAHAGLDPPKDSCSNRWPRVPAHAGMDPWFRSTGRPRRSFPRTRGDGPNIPVVWDEYCPFPPHTWGWTATKSGVHLG